MQSCKMFTLICIAKVCIISTNLFAQVDTAWIRRYNGPGYSIDEASAIAVDNAGNVYVTGCSYGLSMNGDYTTIKYNSNGDTLWLRRYNGPGNSTDYAVALTFDASGNVYVTGYSFSASASTSADYATIKYNSQGIQQWVKRYNGTGNNEDMSRAIALDSAGNVYVTGYSYNSSTISSADYVTVKYNSQGVEQWVQRYDGPANVNDQANALAIDNTSNIYVTGHSYVTGTNMDYTTIKYNSAGETLWIRRYNGTGNNEDMSRAIALDSEGNVYVTGYSYSSNIPSSQDYATIKYNSAGQEQWVRRYNGPGNVEDDAYAIKIDGTSNIYVTGSSTGSGTGRDYATIKYNYQGVQQWVQRYNGTGVYNDFATAISVDGSGNTYVTGYSFGSGTSFDYATVRYNSAGVQQWVQRYNGTGNSGDKVNGITVDNMSNVYVTGYSPGPGNADKDYVTIKYVQSGAVKEIENCKLKSENFAVYPNPASSVIRVSCPSSVSNIKIYDVAGKVVKKIATPSARNDNSVSVSLDGIKNGIYFIKVGDEIVKEKLVVMK